MPYCENCGAKLEKTVRFCENCGAKIESFSREEQGIKTEIDNSEDIDDIKERLNAFKSTNWTENWNRIAKNANGKELGLIVTREQALLETFENGGERQVEFYDRLGDFLQSAYSRGVSYYFLDFDSIATEGYFGSVEDNIAMLKEIVEIARPKYLFILGNESVVETCAWDNEAGDEDESVWGDLGYATLDTTSPWEGQGFNFKEALRVGRLPNAADDTFEDFFTYLGYATKMIGHCGKVNAYGLSALVWQAESQNEYSAVNSNEIAVSPDITIENFTDDISHANLLYFNLHGSEDTRFWYGQDDMDYPEAFSPELLSDVCEGYFIGVEACYGAAYDASTNRGESILLTALNNGCLSFLGSSKIAFGTSSPLGSCADIIIGEYIHKVAAGDSAGDAFISGLQKIANQDDLDDSAVKTIAEFSLYGDPSACFGENKSLSGLKRFIKSFGGVTKGIRIPQPNIRKATKAALAEIDSKINAVVDDFVRSHYLPTLGGKGINSIHSKTFSSRASKLIQKIYYVPGEKFNTTLKVYFDKSGTIKKTYFSK